MAAYWNDYQCNDGNTFPGRLQFNTTTTTTANTASDTVLDFAWNSPRTTFRTTYCNSTSTGNTRYRFDYNGTRDQLQFDINTFQTATGTWSAGGFGRLGKVRHALMQIFEEPSKEVKKEMTKKDRILFKAKRKSEKLLKSMLSKKEYNSLKLHGELEIPSKMDNEVIFIVKKDPNHMVDVKKNGKYSHKLCAVSEDLEMPVGDQLLSKLLLLKTDEKKFKEIAIRHG